METGAGYAVPIYFEDLAKLIYRLGHAPKNVARIDVFRSFLAHLHGPLPPHTGRTIFRLLFPYFTVRRRYGMQELSLARKLVEVLRLRGRDAERLLRWDESSSVEKGHLGRAGCLGTEVEFIARRRDPQRSSKITIQEVDELLDQLAYWCPWSNLGIVSKKPSSPDQVLYHLYVTCSFSPFALSVLTQIILRDLRPLFSPLLNSSYHYTTALRHETSPVPLTVWEAMVAWDPEMRGLHRAIADMDVVCEEVEKRTGGNSPYAVGRGRKRHLVNDDAIGKVVKLGPFCDMGSCNTQPVLGTNVEIPKCEKGRGIECALQAITGKGPRFRTRKIWAETKYDGERMQIHVWRDEGEYRIKIFSKSKRDSTVDRKATHAIILACLGIDQGKELPCHPALRRRAASALPRLHRLDSVILEAEMLPFNEGNRPGDRGPGIEEFWSLRYLSELKAQPGTLAGDRHPFLAFFDILHLNGQNLLKTPYEDRRKLLEETVDRLEGFTQLAERAPIHLGDGLEAAQQRLTQVYHRCKERRDEGIVLKAAESLYNDPRLRWVKLKADYIPGHGDMVDLPIIAAGWDKDRARDLRVGTSVLTTFYVGVCTNLEAVAGGQVPNFRVLFTASYGLDRNQLELLNAEIQLNPANRPYQRNDRFKAGLQGLSYSFFIPDTMTPPSVLLAQPILCELMGAGFQRLGESVYYELRWPRIQKVFARAERPWAAGLDLNSYKATCERALGYGRADETNPEELDLLNIAWEASAAGGTDIPHSCSEDESPLEHGVKVENASLQHEADADRGDTRASIGYPSLLCLVSPSKGCDKRKKMGDITDVTTNRSQSATSQTPRAPQEATAKRPKTSVWIKRSKILDAQRTGRLSDLKSPRLPASFPLLDGLTLLLPRRSDVAPAGQVRPSEKLMGRTLCSSLDVLLAAAGWVVTARAPGQVYNAGAILEGLLTAAER